MAQFQKYFMCLKLNYELYSSFYIDILAFSNLAEFKQFQSLYQ